MADLSKVLLPDSQTAYDIISKKTRGFYRGETDSTSTSTAYTVQISGITELYDGLAILLKNTVIASADGYTINLNNLGAKRVWNSYTVSYSTTGFVLNGEYLMIYDLANDRWVLYQGMYSANSNTIGEYGGICTAGTNGIKNRALFMPVSNTTWESCTTGSGTGTSKARNTSGFLIDGDEIKVRFFNGTSNLASGSKTGQSNAWITYPSGDSRYSFNVSSSWSASGRSLYLKGTITDGKFYLHTTWWADALPSTADGYYYVYIGQMYDAYRFTLAANHSIFYYDENNGIQKYYPLYIDAATVNEHTVNSDVPSNAVFTDTKNTAGATNNTTSSRLYLIGATEKTANPQTYTNENVFILNNSLRINDSVSYYGDFEGLSTSYFAHTKYYSDIGWDPETITYLGVNGRGILGTAKADSDEDIYPPNDSKDTPAEGFYYLANFSANPENEKIIISDGTYGKIKTSSLSPSDLLVKQDNAGFHNSIYRGKNLGSSVTADQLSVISDGTFDDLYIGDYWTIDGVTYRIAGFDLYYNLTYMSDAATLINVHHIIVLPDNPIGTSKYPMNSTATTANGYGGSNMQLVTMRTYDSYFENAFGSAHVLSYYRYLTNAVDTTTGKATGVGGFLVKCDLMSEMNIYGTAMFSGTYDICAESQFPLFRLMPSFRANPDNVTWLNGVANNTQFVANSKIGRAMPRDATANYAIRPYAVII